MGAVHPYLYIYRDFPDALSGNLRHFIQIKERRKRRKGMRSLLPFMQNQCYNCTYLFTAYLISFTSPSFPMHFLPLSHTFLLHFTQIQTLPPLKYTISTNTINITTIHSPFHEPFIMQLSEFQSTISMHHAMQHFYEN